MRSNHNRQDANNRTAARPLAMPHMPMEWLETGSWRLPSGKALAEFALQAGFLAPLLFQAERLGSGLATRDAGSLKVARVSKHLGGGSGQ